MRGGGEHLSLPEGASSPAAMIVQASALTYRHDGADRDTLHGIDLALPRGSLICLAGINGSGKSTLLTLLAGLFPAASGSLIVAGHELPGESKTFRGCAVLVPQDPDLFILGSSVEEDLLLSIPPDDHEARNRALTLASDFGLGDRLHDPVHTLSYGQKRKLCLASALAGTSEHQLELLLLDEPFAGLDHPAALAMRELLAHNRRDGLSQIVVTHDLDLIADLADTFLLMQNGRIATNGPAETVFPHLLAAGVRPPCWWFGSRKVPPWLDR